jgi:UDP-N-acetylglucosamine--N-acetylmuramyl-(pentapeptide) pyrophosphoryl-undecaprenol N-acetylglucosamine transferase
VRLLIAGGGTGGHLFPGIALAREARDRSQENSVLFVGTARGLESRLVPRSGFPLRLVTGGALKGRRVWEAALTLLGLPRAFLQAIGILREWRPDIVLGVGGYASGPMLIAAAASGIARAVIEPNAIPGITNRALGRLVHEVYVAWPQTAARFPAGKAVTTGNPIRREVGAALPPSGEGTFCVLVFGGSQGASRINEAVIGALASMGEEARGLRFVHQTGEADLERVRASYTEHGIGVEVAAFFDDMAARYAAADLVVCRAGATTVTELACAGRGSILIPYPFAADDHQTANARILEEAGAAVLVPQGELTPAGLADLILDISRTRGRAGQMGEKARAVAKPDAARVIVDRLERLAARRRGSAHGASGMSSGPGRP